MVVVVVVVVVVVWCCGGLLVEPFVVYVTRRCRWGWGGLGRVFSNKYIYLNADFVGSFGSNDFHVTGNNRIWNLDQP